MMLSEGGENLVVKPEPEWWAEARALKERGLSDRQIALKLNRARSSVGYAVSRVVPVYCPKRGVTIHRKRSERERARERTLRKARNEARARQMPMDDILKEYGAPPRGSRSHITKTMQIIQDVRDHPDVYTNRDIAAKYQTTTSFVARVRRENNLPLKRLWRATDDATVGKELRLILPAVQEQLNLLKMHADIRRISLRALCTRIIMTAAAENMVDAILDDQP